MFTVCHMEEAELLPPQLLPRCPFYDTILVFAGSGRVLTTVRDDWLENLFALAPVRAYAYVQ